MRTRDDANVVAEELFHQIVVARTVGVRRGGTYRYRGSEGRAIGRLREVVVVDLDTGLPWVAGRRRRQRIEGQVDHPVRIDADLGEEGIAVRDAGNCAKRRPIEAVTRHCRLHHAVPAAEVAPDDVDAAARRIGSRVRIAVHPGAHARHAIEEVDHVEGRAPQRVIGNLCDRDRRREGGAAVL